MKQHIGVKLINAKRMTLGDYNALQGWELPPDQDPDMDGFLVEYQDGGKPNHPEFNGYISWSPAEVFELSYRTTDGMNFGLALEAMKLGKRVARAGWNGKGQYLFLNPGSHVRVSPGRPLSNALPIDTPVRMLPYIMIVPVPGREDETDCVPWLASQSDMLADDWQII